MRILTYIILLAVIIVNCCISCGTTNKNTKAPELRNYTDKIVSETRLPYVLDISFKAKRLIYYGATHSQNPADTMFDDIERKFHELKPEIAFNEGGNWPVYNNRDSTIRYSGESGFLRRLCKVKNVLVQSIEPPDSLEVNHLLSKFKREDILLMYFVRQVEQISALSFIDSEVEINIDRFIRTLKGKGLRLTETELNHRYFVSLYEKFYKKSFDKNTFDPTTYWPIYNKTLLNKISRESSYFRDNYAIKEIEKALEKYDKVFVVMGGSHLLVQEPMLKYIIRKK
jgi:hypothetical protein